LPTTGEQNSRLATGGPYDAGCGAVSDGWRVQRQATVFGVRLGLEYHVVRDGVTPCDRVAPVTDVLQCQPAFRLSVGLPPFASAWRQGPTAASWREAIHAVEKMVIVSAPAGLHGSYEIDDFSVRTLVEITSANE